MAAQNIRQHFSDRVADLREVCSIYDEADERDVDTRRRKAQWIAALLAVLLLRQGRAGASLVQQMDLQDRVVIPVCGGLRSGGGHPAFQLLNINVASTGVKNRVVATPKLDAVENAPTASVSDWLSTKIFQDDPRSLPRKELIRIVRSQDGIAHVDPEIGNAKYLSLRTDGFAGLRFREAGEDATVLLCDNGLGEDARFYIVTSVPAAHALPPKPTSEERPVPGVVEAVLRLLAAEVERAFRDLEY